MDSTIFDLLHATGNQLRSRRLALGFTQAVAAARAGVSYRTWRRMEKNGQASIEDLARAAIALRCEQGLSALFPEPVASSMEDLLNRQRVAAGTAKKRKMRKAQF